MTHLQRNCVFESPEGLTRRSLIARAGLVWAAGAVAPIESRADEGAKSPPSAPLLLAPEATIITRTPSVKTHWIHDPGMARFDDGELFVTAHIRPRDEKNPWITKPYRSVDGGKNWQALPEIPFTDTTPIVHEGKLHVLGQTRHGGSWYAMVSEDRGATWSKPTLLLEGSYWNCKTSMTVRAGQLYWAMNSGDPFYANIVGVACDLKVGLLNPAAWRCSQVLTPPLPTLCIPASQSGGADDSAMRCLEPNVIEVNGRLRVIARCNTGGRGQIASLAAVFDLDDRNGALQLTFSHYHPIPGAQCKMFMFHDEKSRLYWMLSNLVADPLDQLGWFEHADKSRLKGGPSNDRRALYLHYGCDGLSWFPAGCVAKAELMRQSFMYPCAAIDGDDLVFISRTSVDGLNQHDADLCTFHRIADFRRLAIDIAPRTA
ncbi:MAG: hypothetical protein GC162_13345 [Planctomycetes bacterium]|nr:hypothetical protein [Planctomycetota bacterium]